jgi:hypothetical protein
MIQLMSILVVLIISNAGLQYLVHPTNIMFQRRDF